VNSADWQNRKSGQRHDPDAQTILGIDGEGANVSKNPSSLDS
jgi:hypothetical protein